MNKTIYSIFAFVLILSLVSLSSALCLNCNQQNPQVQYYQNANGCSVYSPSVNYQSYNVRPAYSINQPYAMNSMVQYHQTFRHHQDYDKYDSEPEEKKCNWHMSFYRSC